MSTHSQKPLAPGTMTTSQSLSSSGKRGPLPLHSPVWRHLVHIMLGGVPPWFSETRVSSAAGFSSSTGGFAASSASFAAFLAACSFSHSSFCARDFLWISSRSARSSASHFALSASAAAIAASTLANVAVCSSILARRPSRLPFASATSAALAARPAWRTRSRSAFSALALARASAHVFGHVTPPWSSGRNSSLPSQQSQMPSLTREWKSCCLSYPSLVHWKRSCAGKRSPRYVHAAVPGSSLPSSQSQ
mmetsp:Transcript_13525/g.42094  ORF Transcript_13525/g.42094 Transcript_13525/m.42094 type:complete len:249 (-) Transcript_13525:223-969(-)